MSAEKTVLRRQIKHRLAELSSDQINDYSRRAAHHLLDSELWSAAPAILAFASLPREVQTADLLSKAREQGKRVALPRIDGEKLVFHELVEGESSSPRLIRHVLGMEEPPPHAPVADLFGSAEWRDPLVLVPGLAFDGQGYRLGRGRGFYDRFLAELSAETVGVCFECQLVDHVPRQSWDARVEYLLTEAGLRRRVSASKA
jgi:5-formyltetrahydrofolate cyclo-ligase